MKIASSFSTILILFGLSISLVASLPASRRQYDGYKVLRAFATGPTQQASMMSFAEQNPGLDFWTEPMAQKGFTDILARGPEELENLKTFLTQNDIPHVITIDNLDQIILDQEEQRLKKLEQMHLNGLRVDFEEYYPWEDIEPWLDSLAQSYPDLVQILRIGQSTEGRNVTLAKISSGENGDGSKKPAFFLTATIHAREWISTSTALYAINELVTNADNSDLLDRMDFYILPVINVDGYVFSHKTNRMWRKTRSNQGSPLGCLGVDANRNWSFKWGEAEGSGGSSTDKCSETYRGPQSASEPEVAAIQDFVANNAQEISWGVYITLHSYGQYFMSPWGYTMSLPDNYQSMKKLSDDAAAALAALYGTDYETGSSANVLYYTDGTDQDWAYGSGYFPYSYTMELRDTGRYGFVLPPAQIIPTAQETFEAFKVVVRNVDL